MCLKSILTAATFLLSLIAAAPTKTFWNMSKCVRASWKRCGDRSRRVYMSVGPRLLGTIETYLGPLLAVVKLSIILVVDLWPSI